MARATIPVAIDRAVRGRAREQWEYCRAPENFNTDPFSIEHIHPLSRGGSSEENNLALSCLGCNLAKGARIDALDPATGQRITLFHPLSSSPRQLERKLSVERKLPGNRGPHRNRTRDDSGSGFESAETSESASGFGQH